MAKVSILGGGSWGIGLAVLLHKNGHQVTVWSAVSQEIAYLKEHHEHKMLPGVKLPEDIVYTTEDARGVEDMDLLVMAVASAYTRVTAKRLAPLVAEGQMIVNVESAGYDGFIQGTFDRELDAASQMPGDHILEKMTSGAYQGGLIYRTVRGAVQEGLFTGGFVDAFDKTPFFTMAEISDYCANPEGSSRIAQLALRGTLADRALLWALIDDSFERAARMTAVVFAAIAAKMRSGRNPEYPLCMSAEGTTFFKAPLFRPKLNAWLNKWVRDQLGYTINIIKAENATLIGSAVAALAD